MLVMTANMSQDVLAQILCDVDVIALVPKLTQASKSWQKWHGFAEVFLHCASGAGGGSAGEWNTESAWVC